VSWTWPEPTAPKPTAVAGPPPIERSRASASPGRTPATSKRGFENLVMNGGVFGPELVLGSSVIAVGAGGGMSSTVTARTPEGGAGGRLGLPAWSIWTAR